MYHGIFWRLDKFDVHKGRIKRNVETRRSSWKTYGETWLIKFISCEVLLQELVYLINLVSRIKFISCEVLLQELVYLINLVSRIKFISCEVLLQELVYLINLISRIKCL